MTRIWKKYKNKLPRQSQRIGNHLFRFQKIVSGENRGSKTGKKADE